MLFKRKSKDDDFEDGKEANLKKLPKNRAFKDLRPENKAKRKEPKRPWGRGERILITSVLGVTVLASLFLSLSSRSWKIPDMPRIKFPSFSLPFMGGETLVFEGKENLEGNSDKVKSEKVIKDFKDKTRSLSGVYGLFVARLGNGYSYGIYEDETFQAASLIKLPVIGAAYTESESGNLDLQEKYVLKNEDKVAGAGSLFSKPVGYEITYSNLLNLMGKQSDNTAFNIVRQKIGDEKIQAFIKKVGMVKTNVVENETSPKDIGVFLQELMSGNILSDDSKNKILTSLTDTFYENWLVAGVPQGVRVAHKYGKEIHVVNDAGVVFSSKPYIVVVMSKGVVDKEADGIFPVLSKIVFEVESN